MSPSTSSSAQKLLSPEMVRLGGDYLGGDYCYCSAVRRILSDVTGLRTTFQAFFYLCNESTQHCAAVCCSNQCQFIPQLRVEFGTRVAF